MSNLSPQAVDSLLAAMRAQTFNTNAQVTAPVGLMAASASSGRPNILVQAHQRTSQAAAAAAAAATGGGLTAGGFLPGHLGLAAATATAAAAAVPPAMPPLGGPPAPPMPPSMGIPTGALTRVTAAPPPLASLGGTSNLHPSSSSTSAPPAAASGSHGGGFQGKRYEFSMSERAMMSANALQQMKKPSALQEEVELNEKMEAAERKRKAQEDKAKQEAEGRAEEEKLRCHLHKKPNKGCKKCKRYTEFMEKKTEEKAAEKTQFLSQVLGKEMKGANAKRENMHGPLDIVNTKTFNLTPLLHSHVVESSHFKTLMGLDGLEDIIEEIHNFGDTVEPYQANSTQAPSAIFCCMARLFLMNLEGIQLRRLIEYPGEPWVRCVGFLFVRFGLAPEQLWPWLGDYVLDTMEMKFSKDGEQTTTIGEYVESLLTQERYFSTVLPRLPVTVKRHLESKLAQVPQFRKRAQANLRHLETYRQKGTRIEVCMGDGEWRMGVTVDTMEAAASRMKVRIRFGMGSEEEEELQVPLGKIILVDPPADSSGRRAGRQRSRSRSRSPSGVDWSREKGKSGAELLEEMKKREQDRAVASGKDYAKRPVSFRVAMPWDQGTATGKLILEEGGHGEGAPRRVRDVRDRSRSPDYVSRAKQEESEEYRLQQRKVFEKYSMSKATTENRQKSDIDMPDIMRLG
eukprot:TRINITY_DN43503_c0_g1_i1.p1 TRINITY_DN43503_c0_g1~~TRINITY_DN43503_c0_g1_i1.p1  ORF type:complete len:684 (-),score=201.88 TRINITY_DN43503_c0_g1_i1:92-2143(-)